MVGEEKHGFTLHLQNNSFNSIMFFRIRNQNIYFLLQQLLFGYLINLFT